MMNSKTYALIPEITADRSIDNVDHSEKYRQQIHSLLPLIEGQCFKAVRQHMSKKTAGRFNNLEIENEALELSNRVLDTLQRDDYQVLKRFRGGSQLSTYITTIIARQAVDLIRKKLGRSREKERALRLGEIGLLIYEKILLQGCAIEETYDQACRLNLQNTDWLPLSLEKFQTLVEQVKGNAIPITTELENGENNPVVKEGISLNPQEGEYDIPDVRSDPQDLLIKKEKEQRTAEVIRDIIEHLPGEERIILRLRFPATQEEKAQKVSTIASLFGITQKAVYKRIDRILEKCKKHLRQEGVSIHDLF